jgi:hypothetical protein
VYVVENVRQADPARFTLRVLAGDQLQALLKRAREQHYDTLPWPVGQSDEAPLGLR